MDISSIAIKSYFSSVYGLLYPYLGSSVANEALSLLIGIAVFCIILAIMISLFGIMYGWAERKVIARMQSRHGPTYLGKFGLLQNVADLIKLLSKENILPDKADRRIFPFVLPAVFASFALMLAFTPFTPSFVGIDTSIAVILVFVLLSISPILMFLAGWTSGNKYGSISAQRSVAIMISYEIPLMLVVVAAAMSAHSLNFMSIVSSQTHLWNIVAMPIGFVVFFVVLLAELERPPFDLKEADSELISGWLTDVSPPYYALALLLDYARMLFGVLVISVIFLGGWLGPAPLPPYAWMAIKVVLLSAIIIAFRGTFFRMRLDRLIRAGWNYLMPLSILNLLITFLLFVR